MHSLFVKPTEVAILADVDPLLEFIQRFPRLLVLTGAGCSLASGIPTYRDRRGNWQSAVPITHQEFLLRPASRRRYWVRSFSGWPVVAAATPNCAHRALVDLEEAGYCRQLVTQNVDCLHQKAGQQQVVDLHGRLDQVLCLDCKTVHPRDDVQQQLAKLNPQLREFNTPGPRAPDGDADVADDQLGSINEPACTKCGGMLKPNVVFFGDNVDRQLVDYVYSLLDNSDGLLVVGSSVMVFSGYRFCRYASQQGKPVACINPGKTRADDLYRLKIKGDCSEILGNVVASLQAARPYSMGSRS